MGSSATRKVWDSVRGERKEKKKIIICI